MDLNVKFWTYNYPVFLSIPNVDKDLNSFNFVGTYKKLTVTL